jgi:hypothetical protein
MDRELKSQKPSMIENSGHATRTFTRVNGSLFISLSPDNDVRMIEAFDVVDRLSLVMGFLIDQSSVYPFPEARTFELP